MLNLESQVQTPSAVCEFAPHFIFRVSVGSYSHRLLTFDEFSTGWALDWSKRIDHGFRDGYGSNFDFDKKVVDSYGVKWQGNRDFVAKGIKKFKNNVRIGVDYGSVVNSDSSFDKGVDNSVGEFPLKTLSDRSFVNL